MQFNTIKLGFLLACYHAFLAVQTYAIDTYDVVVVGSGPGGLVAAEYLSRDANVKVLVLEAGGPSLQATGGTDAPSYSQSKGYTKFDIPGEYDGSASIFNNANAKYRIDYVDGQTMFLGQLVGGCSSINGALYFRTPDSYVTETQWPFSPDQVNNLFDDMEQMFGHTDNPSPDGKRYAQEGYKIAANAFKNHGGYSERTLNDPQARNAKSKTFGHPPFAIKNGLRDSPAKTMWGPMQARSNVKLLTNAKVSYIKQSKGKATGVVYNNDVEVALSARGAVIMAAGALGTPKVLIQSGIGPWDQLQILKGLNRFRGVNGDTSTWVVNENVGKHIFDTTLVLPTFSHPNMKSFHYQNIPQDAKDQYMRDQTGPLSFPGPLLIAYDNYQVNGRMYQFQATILTNGMGDSYGRDDTFTAALYINNPESRDFASFDANGKYRAMTQWSLYMSTSNDKAAMKDYTQKIVDMLQKEGATFLPGSNGKRVSDWVSEQSGLITHHFGGSCYVSKDTNDRSRCADEKLRVIGTSNIYVSDASAMKDGTVNPYGFIMYTGRQVGALVKDQLRTGQTPASTTPGSTPESKGSCSLEHDVDYNGNDVGNAPSGSAEGCCAMCQARSNCKVFTWTNYNGGTCWFKSNKGSKTNNSGAISAVIGNAGTGCSRIEEGVDYTGNDVGSARSSTAEGCCNICKAKSGCKAFTWTNYEQGTCWLKSGKGSTTKTSGARSAVVSGSTIIKKRFKVTNDESIHVHVKVHSE